MTYVYITAKLPSIGMDLMTKAGLTVKVYEGHGLITKVELLEEVKKAEVLITPLSTIVDQAVIDQAPHLKLIANFGAGFNNIDTKYARDKRIDVTNTPLVSTNATAEATLGLILGLSRRIVEGDRLMHGAGFDGWAPLFFLGQELTNKVIGIIGMGQIGQRLAELLKPFNVKIKYYQRHQLSTKEEQNLDIEYASLTAILHGADIITLHLPLNSQTHHLINQEALDQMKPTTILINAARGPIIDEHALCETLIQKKIAGAALDVYEFEPVVTEGLKALNNVVLTPHLGNASVQARDAMAQIVANNAIAVSNQQPIAYIVN